MITSENVNAFKDKVVESCNILQRIFSSIFTEKITGKLFNNSCKERLTALKKNNMVLLLSSIIGHRNKNDDESVIKNSVEKCLLFHFMLSDLKNKDQRDALKNYDSITYKAGGGVIDILTKTMLSSPESISIMVTPELFDRLLTQLYAEVNNPYERKIENSDKYKNDKRRHLKFFEKTSCSIITRKRFLQICWRTNSALSTFAQTAVNGMGYWTKTGPAI